MNKQGKAKDIFKLIASSDKVDNRKNLLKKKCKFYF